MADHSSRRRMKIKWKGKGLDLKNASGVGINKRGGGKVKRGRILVKVVKGDRK